MVGDSVEVCNEYSNSILKNVQKSLKRIIIQNLKNQFQLQKS